MGPHDLGLTFLALYSEALGTVSGFGSSTFFVPLAIFFESFQLVLALTAILHCFGNLAKLTLFREHFNKRLFLLLALPSIFLTAVGAWLSRYMSSGQAQKPLGVLLVILAVASLWAKRRPFKLPTQAAAFISGISGLLTGLFGTGGALRGIVLTSLAIEKQQFVMLSSGIDLGGDLLRAAVYLTQGYMDWSQWYYVPLLGLAAGLGAWLGRRLLRLMTQQQFERFVAEMVFATGVFMLLR